MGRAWALAQANGGGGAREARSGAGRVMQGRPPEAEATAGAATGLARRGAGRGRHGRAARQQCEVATVVSGDGAQRRGGGLWPDADTTGARGPASRAVGSGATSRERRGA